MQQRQFDPLVAMPVSRKKPVVTHPGYQAAGSHDAPDKLISAELISAVTRHVLRHVVPVIAERPPPRFLVVQGEPGTGKSEGIAVACSRAGFDVIVVPSATLSGSKEGDPIAVLDELADTILAITAREGKPLLIVLDDFDLSVAVPQGEDTGTTINSQLLIAHMQALADKGLLRSAAGLAVPIVMTGNDFTAARGSLLRASRAEFFTLAPGFDERLSMVAHLFGLEVTKPLRALVGEHKAAPIAFWHGVKIKALDEDLDALLARHGFNPVAIDRALRERGPALDVETIAKTAMALAGADARAGKFLKTWR